MALARWQSTIVDESGNIQALASVEVRRESDNGLASLYTDRAGTVNAGNPVLSDSEGYAYFHVAGDAYKITATKGAFSRVWRYVSVGLLSEADSMPTPTSITVGTGGGEMLIGSITTAPIYTGLFPWGAPPTSANYALAASNALTGSPPDLADKDLYINRPTSGSIHFKEEGAGGNIYGDQITIFSSTDVTNTVPFLTGGVDVRSTFYLQRTTDALGGQQVPMVLHLINNQPGGHLPLFAGAEVHSGADATWSANFLTHVYPGATNPGGVWIMELNGDNNSGADFGNTSGLAGLNPPFFLGVQLIGAQGYNLTSALYVSYVGRARWNRGLTFGPISTIQNDIETYSYATASYVDRGCHNASLDLTNATHPTAWSNATAYAVGQSVIRSGSLYACIFAHTNQDPAATTGFWALLATPALPTGTSYGWVRTANNDPMLGRNAANNADIALLKLDGSDVLNFFNGAVTVDAAAQIKITGSTSGIISLVPQAAAGTWSWNWPTSAGSAGQVLTSQGGAGAMTWTTVSGVSTPTIITVANEATDTTCFPSFFTAATGDLGPKTNAGWTLNSATMAMALTGVLTANSFVPTSSTAPANGMYLSAANQVSLVANSTEMVRIAGTAVAVLGAANITNGINAGALSVFSVPSGSFNVLYLNCDGQYTILGFTKSSGATRKGAVFFEDVASTTACFQLVTDAPVANTAIAKFHSGFGSVPVAIFPSGEVSTSTTTGALVVTGGLGVSDAINCALTVACGVGFGATPPTAGNAAAAFIFGSGVVGIYYGTGVPTVAAPANSLYLRTDGNSTTTRLYIRNNTPAWVAMTTP